MLLLDLMEGKRDDWRDDLPPYLSYDLVVHAVGKDQLVGIGIVDREMGENPIYIPVNHFGGGNHNVFDVSRFLNDNLPNCTITGWDCKEIARLLSSIDVDPINLKIEWKEIQFKLASNKTHHRHVSFESICDKLDISRKKWRDGSDTLLDVHASVAAPYVRQDTMATALLDEKLYNDSQCQFTVDLENCMLPTIIKMEQGGVKIDTDKLIKDDRFTLTVKPHVKGGYIHPQFNQIRGDWGANSSLARESSTKGAISGLISLSNPPITQASPRNGTRRAFIPEHGRFFSTDARQIEMRIFAHRSGDKRLVEWIENGGDAHQWTADTCGITREQAKLANFLILYGGSITTLSNKLELNGEDAWPIYENYLKGFPLSKVTANEFERKAKRDGYIASAFGRRRYYASGDKHYTALNSYIQMTRADLMKIKLSAMSSMEETIGFRMRFVSSDEICGDFYDGALISEFLEMMDEQSVWTRKPRIEWQTKLGMNWHDLSPAQSV